jgi:glutamyl-tRNA reductase
MSQQCPGVYDTNLDENQLLLKSNLMQSLRQMNKKSQIFEEIITDYLTLLQSYQNQRNIAEQNTITNSVYMQSLKKQNKELQDMLKNKEETIAKLQKENATVTK